MVATDTRPRSHRGRLLAILGLVAILASSCYTVDAVNHQANDPDTRPWWCMSTGNGGHHVDPAYAGMTKGMLSWDDCRYNSLAFDLLLTWAEQWPTLGDAEADGWNMLVPYVEGMGTHHSRGGIDTVFEPHRPEFLMYDGNDDDAELVGFAWYVRRNPTTPPEGFRGDNDWWHRHLSLCLAGGIVVGEDLTNAQCAALGGYNVDLSDHWMSHAWIIDGWTTQADVFTNHHPCLHAGGPATHGDGDPCWEEAHSGGGHGGH